MKRNAAKSDSFWFLVIVIFVSAFFNLLFFFKNSRALSCWELGPFFDRIACLSSGGAVAE